jgi:hypothetical protein
MKNLYKYFLSLTAASFITMLIVSPAHALTCGALPQEWCNQSDFNVLIGLIVNWIIGLLGLIIAIVILVSAIEIITSAGSPERIKSAKDRIVQAAVSLGLLVSFKVILGLFGTLFNGVPATPGLNDIRTVLTNAIQILAFGVGGLAVIFIIVGGIQYITSGGSPDRVATAKKTITYAIIGVLMSLSITVIISSIHGIFGI